MSNSAYRGLLAIHHWMGQRPPLYPVVKYTIFALLALTSFLYIRMDIRAAEVTLDGNSGFMDMVNMFAISIDYIAWLGLLFIYELETSVIDDEKIEGGQKWLLMGISGFLYVLVFWALVGYLGKLWLISDFTPLSQGDLCQWPGPLSVMQSLDEFVAVGRDNCAALNSALANQQLNLLNQEPIVFVNSTYYGVGGSLSIAWADAIEAVLWILVMGLIQAEIYLQLKGALSPGMLAKSQQVKAVMYVMIVIVTLYYSLWGRALDLYDSVLWLLAFLFIEINISGWNEEMGDMCVHESRELSHEPRFTQNDSGDSQGS